VGRVGNLLCGRATYTERYIFVHYKGRMCVCSEEAINFLKTKVSFVKMGEMQNISRSVAIVRSRTQATEFVLFVLPLW
jgi:hypothetical protein